LLLIEREWKGKREEKLLSSLFEGRLRYTTKCLKCARQTTTTDKFSEVPLSFPITSLPVDSTMQDGTGNGNTNTNTTNMNTTSKVTQAAFSTQAKYQATTLEEMMSLFLNKESLNGNNQYFCENCAILTDAERVINFIE
jgi:ubiquitin C-terminal hydrolase